MPYTVANNHDYVALTEDLHAESNGSLPLMVAALTATLRASMRGNLQCVVCSVDIERCHKPACIGILRPCSEDATMLLATPICEACAIKHGDTDGLKRAVLKGVEARLPISIRLRPRRRVGARR
jgi:hypothetical protein